MNWVFFLMIGALLSSLASIVQKHLITKHKLDAIALAVVFGIQASLLTALYVLVKGFEPFSIQDNLLNIGLNLGLATVGWAGLFLALRFIEAGQNAIISTARVFFTAFGAFIFLDDTLNLLQIIGGLLIFVATLITFWPERRKRLTSRRGLALAAMSAIAFGFAVVNDNVLFNKVDISSFLIIGFMVPSILLALLFKPSFGQYKNILSRANFSSVSLLALLFTPGIILIIEAIKRAPNTSLFALLFQMQFLLTVFLGVWLLKERQHLGYKLGGVIIAAIGAGIISLAA